MPEKNNQIMLISYPDSLGGNLSAMRQVLKHIFPGIAGSLHILPFFPSSGDRGFAPITYHEVDPAFGNWADIRSLAQDYNLMCDFMVNHISSRSQQFTDYLKKGKGSEFAPMFIDYEAFFDGQPSQEELSLLYRRNDLPLYVEVEPAGEGVKKLWCTFARDQIDLDTTVPSTHEYLLDNLSWLAEQGIRYVRLDAYGYITKVRGTNCFFVEPQIWELIASLHQHVSKLGITLLPEVHAPYPIALKIAQQGYMSYDFVLPLLMLHTIFSGSAVEMKHWLRICPNNQFTVLDTHDGIGVYDAHGIVSDAQAEAVIKRIEHNLSYAYKPLDPSRKKHFRSYQLYCTYFSALDQDEEAYLMARAIQFFAPGIPQVYYIGLLAGSNDLSFVSQEDHRAINRRNYSLDELSEEADRPVVKRLCELMRLRNTHPAFHGDVEVLESEDHILRLRRKSGLHQALLTCDLAACKYDLQYTRDGEWEAF